MTQTVARGTPSTFVLRHSSFVIRISDFPPTPPVPIDLDVMRGPAAGDDLGPAVAVEVGGHQVLGGDAAVVDDVLGELHRSGPGTGIVHRDAGPFRPRSAVLVRIALADDQLLVA